MRMRGIPGLHEHMTVSTSPPAASRPAVEGRIAAVLDSAIVSQARGNRHNVAFFAIDGMCASHTPREIMAIVESAFGVDKGSARVSVAAAALSLSFDPGRVAFAAVQRILDRKLAAMRLALLPMSVLD